MTMSRIRWLLAVTTFHGLTVRWDASVDVNRDFTTRLKLRGESQTGIITTPWEKEFIIVSELPEMTTSTTPWVQHLKTTLKFFWSYVKSLRREDMGVADLENNGQIVSESKAKADILNNRFASVFTSESSGDLPDLGDSPYKQIAPLIISNDGVVKQLKKPKSKQSPGSRWDTTVVSENDGCSYLTIPNRHLPDIHRHRKDSIALERS